MMLEPGVNTGEYILTTRSEWPRDGYKFNSELSKCENGGTLSWDNKNKVVTMSGVSSDKCYIYFSYVATVKDYCKENQNLADCNSYRFSAVSDDVNNYVCFDSSESPCPSNNLYRIIGVFGLQVKLIKADYATSDLLGTDGDYAEGNSYYWNYKAANNVSNDWSSSLLNTVNLNTNLLKNLGTWTEKIAITTW